jgi:hypothetical protein
MDTLPPETTYDSAVAHLTRSAGAARELARWLRLPGKAPVADFARALTSRHLYAITPAMVEEACARTTHALAWENENGLRRDVAESVGAVVDWYPNFPIVHTLYFAIEEFRRPPLWDELRDFWRTDEQAKEMLGLPARRCVNAAIAVGAPGRDAEEAMWWRLGNAYYSCLRELYVLAVLRQAGVPAEYHVIADALFRADFWAGDTIISLYVSNAKFRDGERGRKRSARALLGDFEEFRFADMPRLTRHQYGTVHLPSRDDIERFADQELG